MLIDYIRNKLFSIQDVPYRDFQVKLIPGMDPKNVIGVRTPELRKLARQLGKDERIGEFLNDLPHRYFDENQLHAFILSEIKDYDECMGKSAGSCLMWTTGRPVTRCLRRCSKSTARNCWSGSENG